MSRDLEGVLASQPSKLNWSEEPSQRTLEMKTSPRKLWARFFISCRYK